MIPILYKAKETDFTHNGIGSLVECLSCTATEARNGAFELVFEYPLSGRLYNYIQEDCIIKAKTNDISDPQLFRIYRSSRPMSGRVTFYAEHISYLLSGIPIETVVIENANAQTALSDILSAGMIEHEFTAESDIETKKSTSLSMVSVRAALGGVDGSILDTYGGEYEFDNFTIKLHTHRGKDTGIKIAYGKNLEDIKQEKNISEVYTAIFPYARYTQEDDTEQEIIVTIPEKILYSPHAQNYAHHKVCIKDFTEIFEDNGDITPERLKSESITWMENSGFDDPNINITISFKALWGSPEYSKYETLERVNICDTVSVYYEKLGIELKKKIIKTTYDTLNERYISIELGNSRPNMANTIITANKSISNVKTEIETSAKKISQEFKASDGKLLSSIEETLKGYATTEEVSSAINQTAREINLEVSKKVDGENFGTKITQNYESVQIAWNKISEYIKFENAAINIYQSGIRTEGDLLMRINNTGAWYYNGGQPIGKIGTNNWNGDTSFRGLVFDLEQGADYMCWAHRENENDQGYSVKLIYYANNKKEKKGIHFLCDTYCLGKLYINDDVRTSAREDGSGGLYSSSKNVFLQGKGSLLTCGDDFTFNTSANEVIHSYNNLDMHNYDIVNQSDARLKTNISDTEISALSEIGAIDLKQFDWINNATHERVGMIAQQIKKVLPDLVYEDKETGILSIKNIKFIPYLIKAIQELNEKVETLQGKKKTVFHDYKKSWNDTISRQEKSEFAKKERLSVFDMQKEKRKKEIMLP